MKRSVVAAALVAAAFASGCGGDDDKSRSAGGKPIGLSSGGSVAQYADCGDWRRANEADRYATIRELRGQLTPQRSKTAASPLPDERAYELLDQTCTNSKIDSLRLFKLYVRMQGFAPLMP